MDSKQCNQCRQCAKCGQCAKKRFKTLPFIFETLKPDASTMMHIVVLTYHEITDWVAPP